MIRTLSRPWLTSCGTAQPHRPGLNTSDTLYPLSHDSVHFSGHAANDGTNGAAHPEWCPWRGELAVVRQALVFLGGGRLRANHRLWPAEQRVVQALAMLGEHFRWELVG